MSGYFGEFHMNKALRAAAAVLVLISVAAVPVWNTTRLSSLRAKSDARAAAIAQHTEMLAEITRADRDGERQFLESAATEFETKIPLGAQETHLKYLLDREGTRLGVKISNIQLGEPEPRTFDGVAGFMQLPIALEFTGPPAAAGAMLDAIESIPRIIIIQKINARMDSLTKDLEGAGDGAERLICKVEAITYFSTTPAALANDTK